MKPCKDCGQIKALALFRRDDMAPDGVKNTCTECHNKAARENYRRKTATGSKRSRKVKPRNESEEWPMQSHTLTESLDNLRMRKWRGPVNHGCMVATL